MKRSLFFTCLLLIISSIGFAQNPVYINSGDYNPPNGWSNYSGLTTTLGGQYISTSAVAPLGSGLKYFRFCATNSGGSPYGPTLAGGTSVLVNTNTSIVTTTGNTTYAYYLNVASTSDAIVFKTGNGTPGAANFVAFELGGAPKTVSAVTQSPSIANGVNPGQAVTVTATLSSVLSANEAVYIRYTTNGYASSTVSSMAFSSGSSYSYTIPAVTNSASAVISYYIFTSGSIFSGTNTGAGVYANGSNADLFTINYNNNSGSNYNYTVGASSTTYPYISAQTGGWNTAATWVGGVAPPTSGASISIQSGHTITLSANTSVGTISLTGATLDLNANTLTTGNAITLGSGANFINSSSSGNINVSSVNLTISGAGSLTFGSTVTIITTKSIDFGAAGLTTINGTLQLNSGGSVINNSPKYACSALLKYNTGVNPQSRGAEWTTALSGAGYPGNVQISGGTGINGNADASNNITLCGDLTIDFGAALYMDHGSTGNSTLTVGGNTLVNGGLSLGFGTGGDLYMYGNFTVGASGVVNYVTACNCPSNSGGGGRALQFIGTGTQTITYTGGGTLTIPLIDINKASGNVQLATGTNILIPDYGVTNNSLKLLNTGGLDLNGQTLTINGNSSNSYYIGILASGGARVITGTAGSQLKITATSFTPGVAAVSVNSASGGTLVTDVNVIVSTNVGFAPTSSTIVNGTLQLNQGVITTNDGFIADSSFYTLPGIPASCIFGNASTLVYNVVGSFNRNREWFATGVGAIGVTPGYPNNVSIIGNTYVHIGISGGTKTCDDRAMAGSLTIASGSTLDLDTMDIHTKHLTIAGDININGTLNLASGTSANQRAGDIYLGGSWNRSSTGIFNYNSANPRAVTFINSTSGTITASGGETFPYAYLNKSIKTATITLIDSVAITKQLGLYKGTLDLANKNITIVSTRYNTANIDTTNTPSNISLPYSGTGRCFIERFFPARRSWRLLTAPVSGAGGTQTISQAWQEGVINSSNTMGGIVNPSPGYGTLITGPYNGTAGAPYGFDPGTQPHASVYYYSGGLWSIPSGTNSTNVNAYPGYMLFVRGNRNYIIGNQYTTPDTATLHPKGEINIGTQTITAPAAGFQVIGNPYASAFNFHTTIKTGLSDIIYEWDPQLTGSLEVGAFVTLAWDGALSRYVCSVPPASPIDSINGRVESSAAFLVKFNSAGSLAINESDKTSGNSLVFRPANNNREVSLRAILYAYNADGTISVNDGALNMFDQSYNNSVDNADASKFTTLAENIAIKKGNDLLAIEFRKPFIPGDSVFYNLSRLSAKKYKLQLTGTNLGQQGLTAYLIDTLLHTNTPINLDSETNIDFNIPDAATATQSAGRFIIVFKQSSASSVGIVPVTFTNVEAWQQAANSKNIAVEWKVADELNIAHYEVEKSADGENFTTVNTMASVTNNGAGKTYTWMDLNGKMGNNFYRIKSVGTNGGIQYSRTVKVDIINNETGISIYPNPVVNGASGIQLDNMPKGLYTIRVTTVNGQTLFTDQITHAGGSAGYALNIDKYLPGGAYNLEVLKPDNSKMVVEFMVEKK